MLEQETSLAHTVSERTKFYYRPSVQTCDEMGLGVVISSYPGGLRETVAGVSKQQLDARNALGRSFEMCVAASLLIMLSPLMFVVALVLHLQRSGSVLYRQERLGLNGKIFNIFKFRTMVPDAERNGPEICTCHSDPRITFFGKFLRKTKIDELPQLWNVLLGDMAFIGPRPERPCFHEQFRSIYSWEERLSVKPGITGLAQVRPEIGHNPRKKIQSDLEYIENRSLLLNIKILMLTPVAIVLTMNECDDDEEDTSGVAPAQLSR